MYILDDFLHTKKKQKMKAKQKLGIKKSIWPSGDIKLE